MKKRLQVLALCIISLYGLLSCGLEDFYYIESIPDVYQTDNISVQVRLPTDGSSGYGSTQYFRNFIIFYRIYLSNERAADFLPTYNVLNTINPTMYNNYNSLLRYTDKISTTVTSENLENIFYNSYSFFKLALQERDIDDVLSRNALGKTLQFNFSDVTGEIPTLTLSGEGTINLWRAKDKPGMSFATMPDNSTDNYRCFMNFDEIRNPVHATNDVNADVARINATDTTLSLYSYVLFYIAAQGVTSEMPPRPIYSQPTYIGMFRLPNPN